MLHHLKSDGTECGNGTHAIKTLTNDEFKRKFKLFISMDLWPTPPLVKEICFNKMMNWERKEGRKEEAKDGCCMFGI